MQTRNDPSPGDRLAQAVSWLLIGDKRQDRADALLDDLLGNPIDITVARAVADALTTPWLAPYQQDNAQAKKEKKP